VVVIAALFTLVAACGHDPIQSEAERWTPTVAPDTGEQRWTDKITVDKETGALSAPGFNEVVDTAAPGWAKSLDTAAAELLGLNRGFDGPVEVYLLQETDKDKPIATFTLTTLGDDSVQAMRYRVVFDRADNGLHRFVSGALTTKCQSGRGHQDFDTSLCS
jgi:hypothetical protein